MATPINVLLVHERIGDVEHLIGALERAGFEPHWDRAANESEYCTHLDEGLDVILSEYTLSHFNAIRAIELLHERGMDVPFIIVSSSIGEEEAVECMKNGASDCLPKERLGRLATAITHALDQKRLRDDMRYAEEALLESQRNISTLMSNLPGMAYRCLPEPNWAFTYASEGCFSLTGYRPAEFIQDRVSYAQLIHPDDAESVLNEVRTSIKRRNSFELVYRIRTATGEEKWVWERGRGVFSVEKQVQVEGFVTDITQRKRLEEQLRQAAKMEAVGQLAGGVAHDFNNLLTIISTYSQMLLLRSELGEPSRSYIEEIRTAGQRAASLTHQLLAFSRQEIIQMKEVDLNDLVTNLVKMLHRLIGENIHLATSLAPSLGLVRMDPGQLEQVIVNLVVNARDAMPEGGTLTIETSNVPGRPTESHGLHQPKPAVQFLIRDTGQGMDAKTRSRIFEPFFTTKEHGKGTGLGLATVYGIISQSEGTIDVESSPGHGTTFRIQLPRIEEAVEVEQAPIAPVVLAGGTETILVVEDELVLRRVIRTVLTSCGYQILEAANGGQAQQLCKSHTGPIHLLLTDLVMPGINGQTLATQVVALRPSIKVLFMSGYSDDIVFRHGVKEGRTAFLRKPFTADTLTDTVRQALTT